MATLILSYISLLLMVTKVTGQTSPFPGYCARFDDVRVNLCYSDGGVHETRPDGTPFTSSSECQNRCLSRFCTAFSWNSAAASNPCQIYFYRAETSDPDQPCPGVFTFINSCRPPSQPTRFITPFLPRLTTRRFRPSFRPTPFIPRFTVVPSFPPLPRTTLSSTDCPPVKGLGSGLVVLIAIFCAVTGAILGMLIVCCLCPGGKASPRWKVWNTGPIVKTPPCDSGPMATPYKYGHQQRPGNPLPTGQTGAVYSVPKTSYNGEPYNVKINVS